MTRTGRVTALMLLVGLAALLLVSPRAALSHDPQDLILEQVGVDEKLGARLPTDLAFSDQTGQRVPLSRYFTGSPVILTLNYYSCPTLCPLVFRNLVATIGRMGDVRLGKDFKILVVSIDPQETLQRAAARASETYAMLSGIPDPGGSWPFLMGDQHSIGLLAQRAGIRFVRAGNEYAHPNVIMIATPDGRISRYLYGLEQSPKDLKLALLEASGGEIGSSKILNRALLYCFHYDPVGKRYVLLASRIMTGAMVAVLLFTLCLLAFLWKREKKPVARA